MFWIHSWEISEALSPIQDQLKVDLAVPSANNVHTGVDCPDMRLGLSDGLLSSEVHLRDKEGPGGSNV